jgi:hypothetical protein
MRFNEIRKNLLDEAKASPNLLSDLAGLENYIGESYNNRSFIELLQNADDASSTKFKILKKGDYLFVANNGRMFNDEDIESLCRSASSNKVRGESIGYRGIGFKSVVGFAKEIHIISGDVEITFSKKKTAIEIPEAKQVPLIRIPHILDELDKEKFKSALTEFNTNEYTTIFVFSGVTAHEIELEFDSFDTSSLLFLRNICETDFSIGETIKTAIEKTKLDKNTSRVNIISDDTKSSWLIFNNQATSIAFHKEDDLIKKLDESISLVYAFLPTEDASGLGVLINGDFSTDPSRKHLIYDEKTLSSLESCAKHILSLLEANIRRNSDTDLGLVNALIPFMDPRMLQFKKPSFEKYLIEALKSNGEHMFSSSLICPSWLNIKDYSLLANKEAIDQINPQCYNLEGFISFAKYLGANEAVLYSIKDRINGSQVSTLGCVQISVQIFKSIISKSFDSETWLSELKVLMVNNQRMSLDQLKKETAIIDKSFISLLIENGLTEFDIKQVLNNFLSVESTEKIFSEPSSSINAVLQKNNEDNKNTKWFDTAPSKSFPATKSSVHRWRSAEENALEVLNLNGFRLTDVSKQNIGYDIEGFDPDGREIQIEVKSITMVGQKFKLTNNEVAVAQEKKETYYIAVVRQLDDFIEIALISDPVKNLVLNRQCVQWIWECSNYDYNPNKFEI